MITVRQALELPSMAEAWLVGGISGLDNHIRCVRIVDLPEPSVERVKGGELVLTSGISLQSRPEHAGRLVHSIADGGLSGIVLSIGHGLDQIHASIDRHLPPSRDSEASGFPRLKAVKTDKKHLLLDCQEHAHVFSPD